ncbi:MAG: hypothetical protein MJY94_03960 [Bacteroidales bacterium]|nr:hypothetical protein [Bacteroidales bacterium]
MSYSITLPLPKGWSNESEILTEEGQEITHMQAFLPDEKTQSDKALVDIYVGPMPEGSNAEQEAYNSYLDIVGEDEEDDEDPLYVWDFQGKEAIGYEVLCEDNSPMRMMSIEILPGVLCIIMAACRNDSLLTNAVVHLEKNLKIEAE